jgi:hypothetical protein
MQNRSEPLAPGDLVAVIARDWDDPRACIVPFYGQVFTLAKSVLAMHRRPDGRSEPTLGWLPLDGRKFVCPCHGTAFQAISADHLQKISGLPHEEHADSLPTPASALETA